MKKSAAAIAMFTIGLSLTTGCLWVLPEGDVPRELVGSENGKSNDDSLPLKDAEAAMSGAIIRTLIRNGYSSGQVPMVFLSASGKQNTSFKTLLESTGMIRFSKQDAALIFIDSRLKKGVWELRLLKKNGTVLLKKTVKYR